MQFQQAENAEYGLSAVPLRRYAWNSHDFSAWELPCEASGSAVHSLLLRGDTKPEASDCSHQNAPVVDDLNAIVARKYSAEGYQNSSNNNNNDNNNQAPLRPPERSPLGFLGYGPVRFSGPQGFESGPPEGARSILAEATKDAKSLGFMATMQRENHILSERQRRSGMNQLYAKMQSVLPNTGVQKTDKASLVTEMIKYIQSLQRRLQARSKERHGILALQGGVHGGLPVVKPEPIATSANSTQTASSSVCNAAASIQMTDKAGGEEASLINPLGHFAFHCDGSGVFITMVCQKKANLLPSIILVLECYNMEIVDAFVSTTDTVAFNCIHLKAPEIVDPQTTETLKATLQKLMRSDFRIHFPRLTIQTEAIKA